MGLRSALDRALEEKTICKKTNSRCLWPERDLIKALEDMELDKALELMSYHYKNSQKRDCISLKGAFCQVSKVRGFIFLCIQCSLYSYKLKEPENALDC